MLIRIKGVIQNIIMKEGVGKSSGKNWQIKVYVIKGKDDDDILHVGDIGKLENNTFTFHSNHIRGEEVDLMCSVNTNENGFTNVNYWKEYEELASKAEAASAPQEPIAAPEGDDTQLPF